MSERTLRCGNCGAEITFSSPGTLMVVCEHCSWSNVRGDVALEKVGEVAAVEPIASQFQIGTTGIYDRKTFAVRGQLQLDHGLGVWNEWAAELDDGTWLWIAEAQGRLLVFQETESDVKVGVDEVQISARLNLDEGVPFRVTELGEGQVVTVRGELPIRIQVGETTSYADLQRGEREVATIDWTRGDDAEVLVGHAVELSELRVDPASQPDHRPETVESWSFDCPNCGGRLQLLDPERSNHVGCEHCGHLLDVSSNEVLAVEQQKRVSRKPAIPLGTRGSLKGNEYQVLGVMERRVRAGGRWYPWREYLLRTPVGEYHWLIETDGHWMLGKPIQYSAVGRLGSSANYARTRYKHFSTGKAVVHWVLGEFYWQVQSGETSEALDFVNGDRMLSLERTETERSATTSEHVTTEEVAEAFAGFKKPRRRGVGAIQPNHHAVGAVWGMFFAALALLIITRVVVAGGHENREVFAGTFGPTPSKKNEEHVLFSDPFDITADRGNLFVRLWVPDVQMGWVGLNGALVNDESGEVTTFATQAQYYAGVSGGESWSEGNRRGETIVGSVPAGRYRMRLASSGWDAGLGKSYVISVRSQVPRTSYLILAILALLAFPVLNSILHISFEKRRWDNSDHPWSSE